MSAYSKSEPGSVRAMFANIAERYDLLNRLVSLGRDRSWRRKAVASLKLEGRERVADLGCGSGDLALEILAQVPDCQIVASDFTIEMIRVARRRPGAECIHWLVADAQALPFVANSFSATVSGFLLRNVPDLPGALAEQSRILRPAARLAALDTTPPSPGPLRPLIDFYFRRVIPLLGKWLAGDEAAYVYLPQSTQKFLEAEELADQIRAAGFASVSYRKLMLGSIAIHWATSK